MKRFFGVAIAMFMATAGLTACGGQKLEACRIIEIEDAEVEVELGDVDIERGEVEMLCDETLVDVTWGEFRRKLGIDPGQFKNNLRAFEDRVVCLKDVQSKRKEVLCGGPNESRYQALKFSYDD